MKKRLLLLLLAGPFSLFAQNYAPLLEPDKVWTVEVADRITLPPVVEQQQYEYQRDTLIAGDVYGIYAEGIYLREDSNQRQVFQWQGNEACLLYDFSAVAGDTIRSCDLQLIVDSISSIELSNGAQRTIFYYRGGIGEQYYIEGIGAFAGLPHLSQLIGPPSLELMCVEKSGQSIYGDRCSELTNLSIPETATTPPLVFPNPASTFLRIDTYDIFDHYVIYDMTGSLIRTGPLSASLLLDVQDLVPGPYQLLLRKKQNDKNTWVRFVIQR